MLNYILIGILLALSFIDTYLTLNIRKKLGPDVEENFILRELLRGKVYDFITFKILDAILLGFIFTLLAMKNRIIALIILSLCTLMYTYIIHNNYKVWKEVC
jgi:hypothetical protein